VKAAGGLFGLSAGRERWAAFVRVGRCGRIQKLCARSSAGSERLATNQKVGSSNLSGRTISSTKTPLTRESAFKKLNLFGQLLGSASPKNRLLIP
jgi:hypothetical protein